MKTISIVMIVAFVGSVMGTPIKAEPVTLRVHGSSTVFPVVEAAAPRCNALYGVEFDIGGEGSGTGISMLINGETDIADASRDPKESEITEAKNAGIDLFVTTIAVDGIVIVVHPDNPIDDLSIENITAIYSGEITNWSAFGGADQDIKVVERDENSGTHDFFNEFFLDEAEVPQDEVAAYAETASHPETVGIISTEENAIGYIGLAYLDETVKAVSVGGVEATFNNIVSGDYPVSRPLYMITDGKPKGTAAEFIDFILGVEGQSIVYYTGYIPIGLTYYKDWNPDTPVWTDSLRTETAPFGFMATYISILATAALIVTLYKRRN